MGRWIKEQQDNFKQNMQIRAGLSKKGYIKQPTKTMNQIEKKETTRERETWNDGKITITNKFMINANQKVLREKWNEIEGQQSVRELF